jgi:hypothetical protein
MSGSSGNQAPADGRWSISDDGHLCFGAQGKEEAVAARVLGDALFLVSPGYAMQLDRLRQ